MSEISLTVEGKMPSLAGATYWFNSKPLTSETLRGNVVLIDFWTYTCVNSLRTLPYLRAWYEKYKICGLVIIGVHTPEFEFEKNLENVRQAINDMHIEYPVAVDSDYEIWSAFKNAYWPALYFIDTQGLVRHHKFGEGEYEQSELVIQQLLREAGNAGVGDGPVSPHPLGGLEIAADWSDLETPENFLGYERTENFASLDGLTRDKPHIYGVPPQMNLNTWALSGLWTVRKDATVLNGTNGGITYKFHARDLNIVMGPPAPKSSVRFHVLIDGKPPGEAHGSDIGPDGYGMVSEQRTYQLVRQSQPITDRQFEIEFFDAGVEVFDFTFG